VAESGWYPDPANRYQFRFFDGARWTRQVSVNGVAYEDPVPPGEPGDGQWTFCRNCGGIGRHDDDHCWKCTASFPEYRHFGPPPAPNVRAPIDVQFQSAVQAMEHAFEAAVHASEQGRQKDAVRGFDEALWHRHFVEQLLMRLPKGGTAAGLGVSLLTGGFGPTDLLVGPLVRSFINKRQQAKREQSAASDRLIIQAHALLALTECPELLSAPGAEHECLVRLAFAYQPPGNMVVVDHSMDDARLKGIIASQLFRIQGEFPQFNALLCDFVVFFQWRDLGNSLIQLGYPIGHLLTGRRPGDAGNTGSGTGAGTGRDTGMGGRNEALRILGLPSDATSDDVRRAYRDLSKRYHPDLHSASSPSERAEAEEMMRRINAAYNSLV